MRLNSTVKQINNGFSYYIEILNEKKKILNVELIIKLYAFIIASRNIPSAIAAPTIAPRIAITP